METRKLSDARLRRLLVGLTQEEIAVRAGCTQRAVSYMESGERVRSKHGYHRLAGIGSGTPDADSLLRLLLVSEQGQVRLQKHAARSHGASR